MELNKRGIFFTSLVIVILTLFLLSYTIYSTIQERRTTQKRIETMNNFLFSLEEDLSRKIFISGFRIIFLMEKHILETGTYIRDIDESFQEAFFNGTIEDRNDTELQTIMADSTFSGISNFIKERSSEINIDTTFENPEIQILQEDPWNLKIILTMDLKIQDQSNLASWNKTESFIGYVPIEGFQDPVYTIEEGLGVSVNITKTPYIQITSSNINDHEANTYYTNYSGAPNFLNRLEGNLEASSSCCGIESIVKSKVSPLNQGKSVIDYEYFRNLDGINPAGAPAWFLIAHNENHCPVYGFTCQEFS